MNAYLWKAVPVKHKRMQQLSRSHGHQQPTPPPPRLPLKPPILFQRLIRKFQRPSSHIYGDCDPQLIPWVDAQREARQTCANRGGKSGCEGARDARVPSSESSGIFGQEV